MELTLLYDDIPHPNNNLIADHGFSCFLKTQTGDILFDTGQDGTILLENIKTLDINTDDLHTIVISHEHYDHNGGLKQLLATLQDATIYQLGPQQHPPHNTIQIDTPQEIHPGILTTGRLPGNPKDEQSLLLNTQNGIYILAGCSHNEVPTLLHFAQHYGTVIGLIGGLHGFSEFSTLHSLQHIYPCHCTKHKERIQQLYPEVTTIGHVGMTIKLPPLQTFNQRTPTSEESQSV